MADNLNVTPGAGTKLRTTEDAGVHTPHHLEDAAQRTTLLTALTAIVTAITALLNATRPIVGHYVVVPGAGALANPTRRIVANAAGTLTCKVGGVDASYNVIAGQALDVVATHITAAPAGTVGQF